MEARESLQARRSILTPCDTSALLVGGQDMQAASSSEPELLQSCKGNSLEFLISYTALRVQRTVADAMHGLIHSELQYN